MNGKTNGGIGKKQSFYASSVMTIPIYLIDKLRRHGPATDRLIAEIQNGVGEFHNMPIAAAVAFDAADYVWAILVSLGLEQAQESRAIRNGVAQAIIQALEAHSVPERLNEI
ncbi:hypothetical protein [Paracoccus sp. PAMC 22219]|uniref:hypothetical protein n=1 Tax=Paracoccus sp. PAMC 22219 TaxID=1569209 RepID=UPI0012E01449|nr:hypothetical protein [Paracoccus sp. PAMC 22219]